MSVERSTSVMLDLEFDFTDQLSAGVRERLNSLIQKRAQDRRKNLWSDASNRWFYRDDSGSTYGPFRSRVEAAAARFDHLYRSLYEESLPVIANRAGSSMLSDAGSVSHYQFDSDSTASPGAEGIGNFKEIL